mmetsp:Transcript_18813/g.44600  ORF Transcript_18813/g.44600 Transcript_18813/m.44600 type:complete len:360 (-) Transcript_18813:343-1422(-)
MRLCEGVPEGWYGVRCSVKDIASRSFIWMSGRRSGIAPPIAASVVTSGRGSVPWEAASMCSMRSGICSMTWGFCGSAIASIDRHTIASSRFALRAEGVMPSRTRRRISGIHGSRTHVPATVNSFPSVVYAAPGSCPRRSASTRWARHGSARVVRKATASSRATTGRTATTVWRMRASRWSLYDITVSNIDVMPPPCGISSAIPSSWRSSPRTRSDPCVEGVVRILNPRSASWKTRAYHLRLTVASLCAMICRHPRRLSIVASRIICLGSRMPDQTALMKAGTCMKKSVGALFASSFNTRTLAKRWFSMRLSELRPSSARLASNSTRSAVSVPPTCARCPRTLEAMIIVPTSLHGRICRR